MKSTVSSLIARDVRSQSEVEESLLLFNTLPKRLREVAILYSEGWTEREIAEISHVSRGCIRRGRERLQRWFQANWGEPQKDSSKNFCQPDPNSPPSVRT